MHKILIVEDDKYLQRDLKEILIQNEYEVLIASTIAEAMYYVYKEQEIDLYLLDVWLSDGEGFEICREIRKKNQNPIIFLTACDNEEYVIRGFHMGGDDYVTKPFRTRELLSRIHANLRRANNNIQLSFLKCRDLCIDLQQETVTFDNVLLKLRPVEYRLLLKLMEYSQRIVKREQLLTCLWDGKEEAVEDNTLSVQISRLRSKIGSDYIETIRGFGYRFTQKVYKV